MPIKFKCKCGQVLSVPSSMAGKQGKCPKCKNALKVPAPAGQKSPSAGSSPVKAASSAKAAPGAAAVGAAKKAAPASQPALLDSLFDDAGLVEKTGPQCPHCGVDIRKDTRICTACGTNLETGEKIRGAKEARSEGPEFDNLYLQQATVNMQRDALMESRRDKSSMPWWVIMSFLIGAVTLCAAGVVIVDGQFGEPDPENTFLGKVQRIPVLGVLGLTAVITGSAIVVFAHLSICFYAFTKSIGQGFACLLLPLAYSIVYGILNWTDNKAPVKAIITALIFLAFGGFLIYSGGGYDKIRIIFN